MQRFRYHKLVDGEDAYCLTNLEAAISFLETVDIVALTTNEQYTAPQAGRELDVQSSHLTSDKSGYSLRKPSISTPAPIIATSVTTAAQLSLAQSKDHIGVSPLSGPAKRISYLTPVEFAASAATSAVNTADQSLKTIGSSLENSYKFLFGKLSDKRTDLPKTLEDVRKLVGTPTQEQGSSKDLIAEDELSSTRAKAFDALESDIATAPLQHTGSAGNKPNKNPLSLIPKVPDDSAIAPRDAADQQQSSGSLAYAPVADSVRNL
ncbi:hypothetical protein ABW21_db0205727 [Orbilia brochopaga]|nr:hypothetical protein ABW21_db0205727 [Drechslerella brochopaga]